MVLVSSLMDSKGDVIYFWGVLFAWRGFESCCCSGVLDGASPAAVRVFWKGRPPMVLVSSLMDSKGDVRHFFGVLFAWRGFESCCCSGVLDGASPAAVRVFWKGPLPMVLVSSVMDSKGDVRHFLGVLFAWRGFESCCCSGVLDGASSNGFGIFFIMDSKGDVRHFFRCAFCMAWVRILLLFGCFARGRLPMVLVSSLMDSKGDVRHFFGVLFAWRGFESCCCSGVLEGASSNGFGLFFNGFQR